MVKGTVRKLVLTAATAGLVLLAHALLIRWLADRQVAASLLSPGEHLPVADLALMGLFMLVRVAALVGLPGLVLGQLGMACVDAALRRAGRTKGGTGNAE